MPRDSLEYRIDGLNEMLAMVKKVEAKTPLNRELRDAAGEIAGLVANRARRRARTGQQRLVSPTIRAARDRIPAVRAGGSRRLASSTPRKEQPKGGQVFYGANFGAHGGFRGFPSVSRPDYLLFRAIEESRREISEEYLGRIADAFERWG